jgi:hypothetical protein
MRQKSGPVKEPATQVLKPVGGDRQGQSRRRVCGSQSDDRRISGHGASRGGPWRKRDSPTVASVYRLS